MIKRQSFKTRVRTTACVLIALAGALSSQSSLAIGTIAGTDIDNTAVVDYQIAGTPQTTTSNTVTLTVAEVLDVDVTLLSGPVSVASPASAEELLFVLTNIGNGTETFALSIDNQLNWNQCGRCCPQVTYIASRPIAWASHRTGSIEARANDCLVGLADHHSNRGTSGFSFHRPAL